MGLEAAIHIYFDFKTHFSQTCLIWSVSKWNKIFFNAKCFSIFCSFEMQIDIIFGSEIAQTLTNVKWPCFYMVSIQSFYFRSIETDLVFTAVKFDFVAYYMESIIELIHQKCSNSVILVWFFYPFHANVVVFSLS